MEPVNNDADEVELSPLAFTIRIMYLRQLILQFTKQAITPQYNKENLQSDVELWQVKLNDYLERLPRQLKLTTHNIKLHAHSTNLSNFITMHLTWYGTQSILCCLALDGLIEALPPHVLDGLHPTFVVACQQRCFVTAKSMSQLLGSLLSSTSQFAIGFGYGGLGLSVSPDDDLLPSALVGVVCDTVEDVTRHCHTCMKFLQTMFCSCEAVEDIARLRSG